jgi:hypothetical protein
MAIVASGDRREPMREIKSYRLYAKLGASQARRRVKGVGCGVRKIQTAGTGRAVIIHTASGDHRRRLYAIFEGLIESSSDDDEAQTRPVG